MNHLQHQGYNPEYLKKMKELDTQLKNIKGGSIHGKRMQYSTVCALLKFVESKGIRIQNDLSKVKSGDVILVGSTGRLRPLPEDLDFLVVDIPMEQIIEFVNNNFDIEKVIEQGPLQYFVVVKNHRELNFWFIPKKEIQYAYFTYAYPQKITIALRKKAKSLGYLLNQHGLYKNGKLIHIKSYMEIFDYLKVPRRTPIQETIIQVKYKHYSNTEKVLEMIKKNKDEEKWIKKYSC